MAGYMPQDVFEIGAVTVAKLHLANGESIETLSLKASEGYRDHYEDDGLAADWAKAAAGVVSSLRKGFPEADDETLAASCTQLQYCIKTYHPNGSKRRWRLFRGTLFNKLREPNARRVDECLRDVMVYSVGSLSGRFPIAPCGWSL